MLDARRKATLWLILLAAGAFGAVNEIIEWIMTLTIPRTDVGGHDNTAKDQGANFVGGLTMASWTSSHPPERRSLPRHDVDSGVFA